MKPPEASKYALPDFPECVDYIWRWFIEMEMDVSVMTLDAYFRLEGVTPQRWELDCLRSLGRARNKAAND